MTERNESPLVDRLYEAAVLPQFWPGLLHDLATSVEADHGIVFSANGADTRFVASSQQYARDAAEFFTHFAENPRTKRLLDMPKAGFVADSDVFTPLERETLPIFRDFFIPRGYGHGVATVMRMPLETTVVVHIEGRYCGEPFSPVARHWLDGIRPHLGRSALVASRLGFERARTAVETLAALGLAACAVRQSGAVILANAQFEAESAVWTTRSFERIALLDRRADALLSDALQLIHLNGGVRSIPLRAGPETGPAVLHVVPVRRAAHDLFGQAIAILVLTKASAKPTSSTPLLQALFDLSPTEAVIAARVAAGQSVEEIARTDAKSAETVRNQLKSVLAKTGCRRQVDLARMLAQLLPG